MKEIINRFDGDYYYLSNFYLCENGITFDGITYTNSEAAFQAQKTLNISEREFKFTKIGPSNAKMRGRRIKLRSDWEQVKDDLMYQIVKAKFIQNPDIAIQLCSTGDAELIEGNTWHDNYWGDCTCRQCQLIDGYNMLGQILMRVRFELRNSAEVQQRLDSYQDMIFKKYKKFK